MSYLKENLAGIILGAVLAAVAVFAFISLIEHSKVVGIKGQADTILSQTETYMGISPSPGTFDEISLKSLGFKDTTITADGQNYLITGIGAVNQTTNAGQITVDGDTYHSVYFVDPTTNTNVQATTTDISAVTEAEKLAMTEGSQKGLFVKVYEGAGNSAVIQYSLADLDNDGSAESIYSDEIKAKFESQYKTNQYQTVYNGDDNGDGIFTIVRK